MGVRHLQMRPGTFRKIERLTVLSFRNAIRLHEDSIRLFGAGSYPSAYALSVLALEELGKYCVLEDFVWHSRTEGPYTPEEEEKVLSDAYDHRSKQLRFAAHADLPLSAKRTLRRLHDGTVERAKQQALYVGLPRRGRKIDLKGRIVSPFAISRGLAEAQITAVSDFILVLAAGTLRGTLIVDVEELEAVLTHGLIRRLRQRWPRMERAAGQYFNRLMRPRNRSRRSGVPRGR